MPIMHVRIPQAPSGVMYTTVIYNTQFNIYTQSKRRNTRDESDGLHVLFMEYGFLVQNTSMWDVGCGISVLPI